jgi:hypothetical protein
MGVGDAMRWILASDLSDRLFAEWPETSRDHEHMIGLSIGQPPVLQVIARSSSD